jgi:hypothetical protein
MNIGAQFEEFFKFLLAIATRMAFTEGKKYGLTIYSFILVNVSPMTNKLRVPGLWNRLLQISLAGTLMWLYTNLQAHQQ